MSDVPARSPTDIVRLRQERLIPSLTLSYNPEPIKIVKVRFRRISSSINLILFCA